MTAKSRCKFLSVAGAIMLGGLSVQHAARADEPSNVDRCAAIAAQMNLGAPVAHTAAKLKRNESITIVALGSSSTTGFGTLDPAFPEVLKRELARRHPSLQVKMIGSGRLFDTIPGSLDRIDNDVLRYRPDLVIWQLGTNDVLWHGFGADAKGEVRRGVQRMKKANADVILMDLQDAPLIRAKSSHRDMEKLIADVAREESVGLFPRYEIMKRADKDGISGLVALDGLHNSGAGYRCIGLALARMIDKDDLPAKRPPLPTTRSQ